MFKKEYEPQIEKKDNEQDNMPISKDNKLSVIIGLFEDRNKMLESVKGQISLKFYYQIKEKIANEKKLFLDLTNLAEKRKEALAEYSFILDPVFFEQILFNKNNE